MSISGCLCFCEANDKILNEVWSTFFKYLACNRLEASCGHLAMFIDVFIKNSIILVFYIVNIYNYLIWFIVFMGLCYIN